MRYYTAAEARKVLGDINANKLKHYVDLGIINRYMPPGRKQGLYSKKEVDALAEEIRLFYEGEEKDDSNAGRSHSSHHTGRSPTLAS